jgi:2-polyprenyl-6-methoxyphenol hydroxylase-like FAD-dependent oxidoreductase
MTATTDSGTVIKTTCCVVGGGPAGIMLGFLLARAGVEVQVLEKHGDFFRDFRGDTIHPSTLELMYELGILDEFLKLPHQEYKKISATFGDVTVPGPNFAVLPTHCKFMVFMPQWDFLSFMAEHAKKFPQFHMRMNCEATDLIYENEKVVGVVAHSGAESLHIIADLVVACDGRTSVIREKSGLEVVDLGAPIDVLWMRIPRFADDPAQSLGHLARGKALVMINRGEYYQCGLIIPKGGITKLKELGIDSVRRDIVQAAPFLSGRIDALKSWDDIKLLNVQLNHLKTWHQPGLLCIGDAAHAMSPVAGVGVNYAVQDAVATANILLADLKNKSVTDKKLSQVQLRREEPTRRMQAIQQWVHERMQANLTGKGIILPWYAKLGLRTGVAQYIAARVIGLGFRQEHIDRM